MTTTEPLSDYDLNRIKGYGTHYGLKLTASEADGLFARLALAEARATPAAPTTDPTAADVLAVLAKATRGEWWTDVGLIVQRETHAVIAEMARNNYLANAAAIVAAVNYLRSPAFAALLAENERLREAAKTYLRATEPFNPMLSGRGENPEWQARAVLVAALAPRP